MTKLDFRKLVEAYQEDKRSRIERDIELENVERVPADDSIGLYFRQMASEPLLTAEGEVALAKRIERGKLANRLSKEDDTLSEEEREMLEEIAADGRAAREHMAHANTRLVVNIAKHFRNHGLPLSDLIQEGNIGLMKAIDRFDYTLGNRFSTYATWWIRQSISRGLSKKADTIRLPLNVSAKRRKAQKAANILYKELGYQPSYEEIAERTGMKPKEIYDLFEGLPHSISLQTNVGEDGELGDLIVDKVSPILRKSWTRSH